MDSWALGRSVLVPVANPASVPPLLEHAARIAFADDGRIEIITVLREHASAQDHARAWSGLAEAERLHDALQVPITGRVVHADDPASGVLEAIDATRATLVLMGWRGTSSTTDVFGRLIDRIVGHSTAPLAILRLGTQAPRRIVLPISSDHLLPGGESGLALAGALTERLAHLTEEPTTVLRTGAGDHPLPPAIQALGDRVHHDARRNHHAVAEFARRGDLIIASVAPTVSGLRNATTHLAWAAPEATLLIAVDVGRRGEPGLVDAVEDAGRPAPQRRMQPERTLHVVVTARLTGDHATTDAELTQALRDVGATHNVMTWWPAGDEHPHVRATVSVQAPSTNHAIARVMTALHDAPELRGAEISYDVERA
ncbi:MAG: universal stress protein [Nitriliruptoraceae bacterium]